MIIGKRKSSNLCGGPRISLQQIEAKIKKRPTVDNRVLQGLFSPDLGRCSSTRGCDKSSIMERKTHGNKNKYVTPKSVVIQGEVTDIDTSNTLSFLLFQYCNLILLHSLTREKRLLFYRMRNHSSPFINQFALMT